MKTSDHLDRIFKLGFRITLSWNEDFEINMGNGEFYSFNANNATDYSMCILRCSYYKSETNSYTYEQMIEVCCDLFYSWYNKNLSLIKDFDKSYNVKSMEKLEDRCLGEVTKIVARELKLDDIIGLFTEE